MRRLQRETPEGQRSVHVFVSERLAPLSVSGYQRMVARAGEAAKFPFLISSHVLRHSCGYKLANDGQDTRAIQHRSIASTVRYTKLAPDRFKGLRTDIAHRAATRVGRVVHTGGGWIQPAVNSIAMTFLRIVIPLCVFV